MDCQSTNILEITRKFATLTANSMKDINADLEEQLSRLDFVYKNVLNSAKNLPKNNYETEKKMTKRQSRTKNAQVSDLFATIEPDFQQPAVPPIRRTRRQASIIAVNKKKNVRESATISSGSSTRASRARAISTFMDIAPLDLPKANSTFVVDKKFMDNIDKSLSPQMFPFENEISKKPIKPNETYKMPTTSKAMNTTKILGSNKTSEESPISVKSNSLVKKIGSKKNSNEYLVKNKCREKLEDIDVNIEEQPSHMTRTMKRKLQEEIQIDAKKKNLVLVPLEMMMTPQKPPEDALPTPHQLRENEAEKRKELYLKSRADQKKFDVQHLKVAKQREEQMKRAEEKIRQAADERKKKEEKQKEKELLMKEEALKKQKLAELKLAEINAKRKQADEAKILKAQKAEKERKLKEAETKKKLNSKSEKTKSVLPKVVTSNIPTSIPKMASTQKSKIGGLVSNTNDYGLNDVSARDSSDDESGPKKPVPSWALRENRKAWLEAQSGVDSLERDLFFNCPTSMSIKEMFKGWNIRDRQRTSSAVWITPPRYSEYIRKH